MTVQDSMTVTRFTYHDLHLSCLQEMLQAVAKGLTSVNHLIFNIHSLRYG